MSVGIQLAKEDFKCSICIGKFVNPKMTKCQHVFCEACIMKWNGPSCPLCNRTFKKEKLVTPLLLTNLINQVKGVQEAVLPTEEAEKIPSPLNVSPVKVQKQVVHLDDATCALLLDEKLVNGWDELFLLDQVLETGALELPEAKDLIRKLSIGAETAINRLLGGQKVLLIFDFLFKMAFCNKKKTDFFIPDLFKLLEYTVHCKYPRAPNACILDLGRLENCFHAMKQFLPAQEGRDSQGFKILNQLIYFSAHPRFSSELKLDLLFLIQDYCESPSLQFQLLASAANMEHALPLSQSYMAAALHRSLMGEDDIESKLKVLAELTSPHMLKKLESTDDELVGEICDTLLECVRKKGQHVWVVKIAVSILRAWIIVPSYSENILCFPTSKKKVLNQLLSIAKSDIDSEAQLHIYTQLFEDFSKFTPLQPPFSAFFNAYYSLLNDDDLHVCFKTKLTDEMPLGKDKSTEPQAKILFYMMHEKIQHSDLPVELTKIYIYNMAKILSNCRMMPKSFLTDLSVVKNNPEFLQIAQKALL